MKFLFILTIFPILFAQPIIEDPSEPQEYNIFKGWLHFFTFVPDFTTSVRPTKFEYNPAFLAQEKMHITCDLEKKDEWGTFDIPNETSFFFVLTKKSLYVVSARRNDIAKTYKSIEISWLIPEEISSSSTLTYRGGLEDIGNYKDGFCFRLRLQTRLLWNVCAETQPLKEKWMSSIYSVMPKNYTSDRISSTSLITSSLIKLPFNLTSGGEPLPEDCTKKEDFSAKRDGYWIVLQEWSQCSLACGGGKQFLQRMCMPPRNGGRRCEGDEILNRECNTQPCPNVLEKESEGAANPTVVKMQRLWTRGQRYEVCVIKEGDMDVLIDSEAEFKFPPRYPCRVVLNNKTISIFTNPSFDSVYKSFDLPFLDLNLHPKDPRFCILLKDKRDATKNAGLCIMPSAVKEGRKIEDEREEWITDIRFFRDKCKDKDKYVEDEDEMKIKKQKELFIEDEIRKDKLQRIKEKDEEGKQKEVEKKVGERAHIALEAIEKEIKFEQLAVEEELIREKEEDAKMEKEIIDEENKKQCLQSEIKKKSKLKNLEQQTKQIGSQIEQLEQEAVLQVKKARQSVIDRINRMQRAAERRRREAKRKMTMIRATMASSLLSSSKIGNYTFCFPNQTSSYRENYCTKNFQDEPEKNSDCRRSPADFCSICCENEFGENQEELRTKCYGFCEEEQSNLEGFWTYVPDQNKISRDSLNLAFSYDSEGKKCSKKKKNNLRRTEKVELNDLATDDEDFGLTDILQRL